MPKDSFSTSTKKPDLGQASVAAVNQYLQLASAQQIDTVKLLNKLNISSALLADNSQNIPGLKFQQLIAELIEISKDPLFGLHTAQFVQPASYSVLGFISMNCDTLGEAISKIPAFEKLVGDMGITRFTQQGESFQISWHCLFTDPLVKRHMIDNCLASWLNFAHYLANKKTAPEKVFFSRKRPGMKQQLEYQKLFNCEVLFNQTSDSIFFHKRLLDYPLTRGNKQLLSTLENYAEQQLADRMQADDIVLITKKLIRKNLAKQTFRQVDIAIQMNIGAKTLQRRLKNKGTSFQSLLDSTRLEQAKSELKNFRKRLFEISDELGFKEPRSFYRWFSKLTGKKPGEFRKNL